MIKRIPCFLMILFLSSCQVEMPGTVTLSDPDQTISLKNKNDQLVELNAGPNKITAYSHKIKLLINGELDEFRFPRNIRLRENFYYSFKELKQPVSIKGQTTRTEGDTWTEFETRSCRDRYCSPGDTCYNRTYTVEVTYQEIFKQMDLFFFAQDNGELGNFHEENPRRYKEVVGERQISHCW